MPRRNWFTRSLRSWFKVPRPARACHTPYHLSLEALEDRCVPSATPVHVYDLNGSLADNLGGPALTADGGTLTASRYVFDASQGLRLSGALADTGNYSVVVVAQLDSLNDFFLKLIDFQDRTSD